MAREPFLVIEDCLDNNAQDFLLAGRQRAIEIASDNIRAQGAVPLFRHGDIQFELHGYIYKQYEVIQAIYVCIGLFALRKNNYL